MVQNILKSRQLRSFNPASKQDLAEYREFLRTQRWSAGCPFQIEWPYNNVVDMIENKIVKQHIDQLIEVA
jgi:hypothetical protein